MEALVHARLIVEATDLPVSRIWKTAFVTRPSRWRKTIRLAQRVGPSMHSAIVRHDIGRGHQSRFSRSAENSKSVASTIKRACTSASSRVSLPSLDQGSGRRRARCGQRLEIKAGEDAGGANIPWIRNYECARPS